jgi:DNA-binding transcriptional LysR family regulator
MIGLHRLEGFFWVARTGGYARAARAFPYPITQPAVHQQVKKLEGDLSVALFERVQKDRMALTPAGERLYAFVAPFFEQLPGVLRSLQSGDYAGVLRIHAAPLMIRHLMPDWIKRVQDARPGIQIELRELATGDVGPLRSGDADMIVDYLPEIPAGIASMQVATMHGFIVLPTKHPLAKGKQIALTDLAEETFISYSPGTVPYAFQMKAFEAHAVEPRSTLSANSADAILGFVGTGLGYSLVPSIDPRGPGERGIEARLLSSPKVEFPVYAAWRLDTPENPLLDCALEMAPKT